MFCQASGEPERSGRDGPVQDYPRRRARAEAHCGDEIVKQPADRILTMSIVQRRPPDLRPLRRAEPVLCIRL